jgi:hypothetical protein
MDSYLIRIYRRSKDDPKGVVGVVEEIDSGQKHAFQNLSGLCRMLTPGKNLQSGKNVSAKGSEINGKQATKKTIT